jgi:hypothetical protein
MADGSLHRHTRVVALSDLDALQPSIGLTHCSDRRRIRG